MDYWGTSTAFSTDTHTRLESLQKEFNYFRLGSMTIRMGATWDTFNEGGNMPGTRARGLVVLSNIADHRLWGPLMIMSAPSNLFGKQLRLIYWLWCLSYHIVCLSATSFSIHTLVLLATFRDNLISKLL
jgi:hypothetical protein